MSEQTITVKIYICDICGYQSKNSTDFNTCLVCGKKYCIFLCKNDLYFVYHQNVCRICKDNPMVDEITEKWLAEWRAKLPIVKNEYSKISKKALRLDRRFTKNWQNNLKKYEIDLERKKQKFRYNVLQKRVSDTRLPPLTTDEVEEMQFLKNKIENPVKL